MKVGLVLDTTLDSDAGVQQYFKGLARYLIKNGHTIRFLVPQSRNTGEFKGKIINLAKLFNPLGNSTTVPISFSISGSKKIKKVLEKEKFDVIHISAPFSPFMGAKVVQHAKCPVVIIFHTRTKNWFYRLGGMLLRLIMWPQYKKIDGFISVSDVSEYEAKLAIPGDYTRIPNAVDVSLYSPKVKKLKKFDDGIKNILFLGRLEDRKGAYYAIKAFEKVSAEFSNSRLIIAGDGPLRNELEQLVRDLKIKNVVFEGYIDEELKPNYYSSADICVFPALYGECFGIVLVEAMASGKIPLAFDNKGYSFVLKGLPELLIEKRDTKTLSKKILFYLKNPIEKKGCEKKCLEYVKRFSWESVGDKVMKLYKSLI
jgi:phosphatidylinositol alpha-mannosyltransferase